MKFTPVTIRARLTLWHAVIMMLILSSFALGTYAYVRESLFSQIDARLDANLALAIRIARTDLNRLAELEQNGLIHRFSVLDEDDWPLYVSGGWLAAELDTGERMSDDTRWIQMPDRGGIYHMKENSVRIGKRTLRFFTAEQSEQIHRSLDRLRFTLLGGLPVVFLLSLLGGYFLAGRILTPLQRIMQRARTISADNLSERLEITNPDDELGQLSTLLNEGFARLDDSFRQLRQFTQDAAHELRTPLAVLRGVGEVGLQEHREAAAYREVIGSMLEEVERMSRLVEGLLTLAKGESGRFTPVKKPENIASMIGEVVECLRVLAEEKNQLLSFHCEHSPVAQVDRDTMILALMNLVSNAIRYTQDEGAITLTLHQKNGNVIIDVKDNGPGIAPEHHPYIFDRFYRVDASRAHHTGGTGLGLAIARWAVEANCGTLQLLEGVGCGCLFSIHLPSGSARE